MADPVCIFESNQKGSIVVITDMHENGANVLVAVKLDVGVGSNPKIVVNRISCLYGKERIETLLKHPALYVNTAKASRWVVGRGLQLPTVTNPSAGSNGRIQTPADLVKYIMESGLSFSLSGLRVLEPANTKPVFEASSKKHKRRTY